ncbi:hypothetical protein PNEG_03329 [Pneumocystis murina B123]|uniref:Amino acid transporter transmembrane domain-containing protein n=1 Tax=Pneumocystis murina (strain B123) TaxID=1069680 RepID=M7PDG7_PNEMU|nr:hypothetical protein PNEG_03329 [Pneumocystis murina B123]EMR08504.1 hypothetical protein PNEG_03329 [Pneumocystis murina B123]
MAQELNIEKTSSSEHPVKDRLYGEKNPFEDESNGIKYRTMTWIHTGILMTAETISLGVLSLPSMYATLGINLGLFFVLLLGIVATYTGYVLGQFKARYPFVYNMSDVAYIMCGPIGRKIMGVCQIVFLISSMGSHVLTGGIVFNTITNHAACTIVFSLATAFICMLFTLPRTFKFVSYYSVASFASIMISLYLIVFAVSVGKRPADITFGIPKDTTFLRAFSSITNIIFAYGGHVIFFSLISEMKNPSDYVKSLYMLQICDIFVYLSVVIIYIYVGDKEFKRLSYVTALSAASPVIRKVAYGISIPTVIIAGSINAHVSAKYIMVYISKWCKDLLYLRNYKFTLIWVSVCSSIWLVSWFIAEIVPIYNDLLGLIGSLFISWFTYGTGGIFWLYLEKGRYFVSKKSTFLFVVNTLIVVLSFFTMCLGVYSNAVAIHNNRVIKGIFSCA